MPPAILRARRVDSADLTRISRAAKRHWGYPEQLLRLWQRDLTVTPGFIARHPVWYAVHRNRPVGFYAISGTGDARELEHMWVHPKYIGAGVGRALFAHLLRRLRTMKISRLDVASDPNAEGFYRRMGARRVGVVASTPEGRVIPLLRLTLRARRAGRRGTQRNGPERRQA
jgi:GNAT superfamily N-acetyltransferase